MPAGPVPTFADVLAARRRIAPYLRATALHEHPALDELVGTSVLVKHENHQPTGAFKVRGGLNLVARLSAEERRRGLIAARRHQHEQPGSGRASSQARHRPQGADG